MNFKFQVEVRMNVIRYNLYMIQFENLYLYINNHDSIVC